jgi:hypothetical protein
MYFHTSFSVLISFISFSTLSLFCIFSFLHLSLYLLFASRNLFLSILFLLHFLNVSTASFFDYSHSLSHYSFFLLAPFVPLTVTSFFVVAPQMWLFLVSSCIFYSLFIPYFFCSSLAPPFPFSS